MLLGHLHAVWKLPDDDFNSSLRWYGVQGEFGEYMSGECKPGIRPFGPTPRLRLLFEGNVIVPIPSFEKEMNFYELR